MGIKTKVTNSERATSKKILLRVSLNVGHLKRQATHRKVNKDDFDKVFSVVPRVINQYVISLSRIRELWKPSTEIFSLIYLLILANGASSHRSFKFQITLRS